MRSFIKALAITLAFIFSLPTTTYAASRDGSSFFSFSLFKRDGRTVRKKETIKTRRYALAKSKRKLRKSRKRRAVSKRSRARSRAATRRANARRAKARRIAKARRAKAKRARAAKRAKLYARTSVRYRTREKRGTIIIDTRTRHLYHVQGNGRAVRYGVAVGKAGFAWSGTSRIRRKVKWPTWTPPAEMIERTPKLAKWKNGQPGGPTNPLGAAALYLFQGKKDTLYRIHGTNAPSSIGRAASSGCIRMKNEDIQHLYSRVGNGTKVIVQ